MVCYIPLAQQFGIARVPFNCVTDAIFPSATAIIFLAPISAFDQVRVE